MILAKNYHDPSKWRPVAWADLQRANDEYFRMMVEAATWVDKQNAAAVAEVALERACKPFGRSQK